MVHLDERQKFIYKPSLTALDIHVLRMESFNQGHRLMIRVDEEKQQIFEVLKPLQPFKDLIVGHDTHGFKGCMTAFLFNSLPPLKLDHWSPETLRPCGTQFLLRKLTREAGTEPTPEQGLISLKFLEI